MRLGLFDALRILFVGRPQPVQHDLLHRQMHIEIVEAVAQPRLQSKTGVIGNESRGAAIVAIQIFNDDAGFRHGLVPRVVAQHRKFAYSPQLHQRGALGRIAEIDQVRRERDVVLVQRNQRLPAIRGQRVEMQRQRHGQLHTDCDLQLVVF